jgi:hypothetical protein
MLAALRAPPGGAIYDDDWIAYETVFRSNWWKSFLWKRRVLHAEKGKFEHSTPP